MVDGKKESENKLEFDQLFCDPNTIVMELGTSDYCHIGYGASVDVLSFSNKCFIQVDMELAKHIFRLRGELLVYQ